MDFFKSCKTNVQIVEHVSRTRYTLFRTQESEDIARLQLAISKLRAHGILCASLGQYLVAFELASSAEAQPKTGVPGEEDLLALGYYTAGTGTIETPLSNDGDGGANLESLVGLDLESLLGVAVEDAMTEKLQSDLDIFRIGPFSWLCQNDDEAGNGSLLLRLSLHSSDGGAIYAATSIEDVIIQRADRLSPSAEVILAPFGRRAKLLASHNNKNEIPDDNEQSLQWKSLVMDALRRAKAQTSGAESWCLVQLHTSEAQQYMLWPERFVVSVERRRPAPSEPGDWRAWLARAYEDPWDVAEGWRLGAEERELAIKTRSMPSELPAEAASDSHISGPEQSVMPSPAFLQRTTEQQLAASGIYPTPPDGLAPASQAQPFSMDSVLAANSTDVNDAIDEYLPEVEGVREHSLSSIDGAQAVASNNSDLFGDHVGEMDFATGEVGDADFSFFDEPDEMSISHSVTHTPMDVETNAVQPSIAESRNDELTTETTETTDDIPRPDEEMKDEYIIDDVDLKDPPVTFHDKIDEDIDQDTEKERPMTEKPLSPFGIRERLLPPPIPASIAQNADSHDKRSAKKASTFDPIVFRDGMSLLDKYGGASFARSLAVADTDSNDISLPRKFKRPRFRPVTSPRTYTTNNTMSDDESSDTSDGSSQASDDELSTGPAWISRKRKRASEPGSLPAALLNPPHSVNGSQDGSLNLTLIPLDLGKLFLSDVVGEGEYFLDVCSNTVVQSCQEAADTTVNTFNLSKLELVMTAQLASAQDMSCVQSILHEKTQAEDDLLTISRGQAFVQHQLESALRLTVPSTNACDISDLAIAREAPARPLASAGAARPGQPRPPQRGESINLGPDIFAMPTPYIRTGRGQDMYELLPIALTFWEVLNLGPASGAKDIRAFGVVPSKNSLRSQTDDFLEDLSTAYEGCKLGSHVHKRSVDEANALDDYENGLAVVELDKWDALADVLAAYGRACTELGRFLASIADAEPQRTIVVYMVDVFECCGSKQWLCAAFWVLYRSYRDNIPKTKKSLPHSDLVLQVLPRTIVASCDSMVILEPSQLARLAREVYDRCPPSTTAVIGHTSPLPNFSAPFVELANAPPKRIGFQLAADPPSDLLHEGSNLHLAYSISADSQWLCVSWTDNTGRYASCTTICLCGTSLVDALEDVWRRTRDIMLARDVFWRIYIVATERMDDSMITAWRSVIETPRKQAFSVTLLFVELDPTLKLRAPGSSPDEGSGSGVGGSTLYFLTPVTTPQASGSMTVSPDTSGPANAPPTPAPSDLTASAIEQDPDTHLIDLTEDTWAVVLQAKFAHVMFSEQAFVSGLLCKRGEAGLENAIRPSAATLPSLGVDLMWTVQVRPTGNVDEGNLKHAEITMREVLRLFRNLSILTKAKGWTLREGGAEIVPVHVMAAIHGARGVNGLLG